jgi:riboflavin biosynthesis pyrimidine reductase
MRMAECATAWHDVCRPTTGRVYKGTTAKQFLTCAPHSLEGPVKPHVICHMLTSLDGVLHPSRFTASGEGGRAEWLGVYEQVHQDLAGDAWIVGRVTMAEMSKAGAHPLADAGKVDRPYHFAQAGAGSFAVALDASGKLHFSKPDIGGDHVFVLLGHDVADSHLAELASDGVSYIVAESGDLDLAPNA